MFRLLVVIVGSLILAVTAAAGPVQFAGTAEGFAAAAYGPAAVSWNPANLTLFPGTVVEVMSLRGGVGNNSYSISDYNRFNGSFWDDEMKAEILSKIDGDTFEFDGSINARVAGLSIAGFAMTTETRAISKIAAPKEMFELILNGNTVGRSFSIDGAEGGGIAFTEMRLSAARPLVSILPVESSRFSQWHGGVSLKILKGWGYGELLEARGGITTSQEMVYGDGHFRSQYARGGKGFGFDLGFAGPIGENWIASMAMRDLFASINWTRDVEERIESFDVPGLILGDSVSVNSSSATRSLSSVKTSLPVVFSVGAARQGERFLHAFHLEMATKSQYGSSTTPRLALASGWKLKSRVALRASAATGGNGPSNIGGSLGLALGVVHLNLGLHSWGSLNPFASKGMGFISGMTIEF